MQAWQATVQDDRGNAVPNPVVSVYEADGTTLSPIFNEAGVALPNPITGSVDGFVQFYAGPGPRKIEVVGGETWDIDFGPVFATNAQATTGTSTTLFMNPANTRAAIDARITSQVTPSLTSLDNRLDDAEDRLDAIDDAPIFLFPSLIDIISSENTGYSVGDIITSRKEGFSFRVSSENPDIETSGGVILEALPDSEGFVHVEQFGAIPDGNRYTGAGTDNTDAMRRAFATQHHIIIGKGTYRVTQPIWNVVENRIVKGSGMGVLASSRETIRYFNPPSCILATGTATRRVITRRRYRASAADPNDAPLSAVLENWGGGTVFQNFSIELFCDYSNESPTNLGADWDIGFFNGCRGSTGLEYVSILGYFRRYGCLWDGTDAYGIPNHLDPEGNPILLNGPSGFGYPKPGEPGGSTIRSSGADHCWMKHCEVRGGRVGRGILGADRTRTGAPYYDYLTDQTYDDFRGGSGSSDFRSTDCSIFGPQHHSGYRLQNPIGWGSALTVAGMDAETDIAPAAQHIDWWATNNTHAGPGDSARGMVFNDLRYVSWEMFNTRHGACHEVYYGPRVWTETGDGMYTVRDTSGNIISNTYDDARNSYGVLATNDLTGVLRWENISTHNADQKWVRDWRWVTVSDRGGRIQGPRNRILNISDGGAVTVKMVEDNCIWRIVGRLANGVTIGELSGSFYCDVGSTPRVVIMSALSNTNLQGMSEGDPSTVITPGNVGIQSRSDGSLRIYNRHAGGAINLILSAT